MTDYCEMWSALVADPENQSALQRAREDLGEFLDHSDTCTACDQLLSETPEVIDRVGRLYAALTADSSSDGSGLFESLHAANAEIDDEVRAAVTQVLLPSLPDGLSKEIQSVDPLVLFRVLDALVMVVRRRALQFPDGKGDLVLSSGGLSWGQEKLVPRDSILWEMKRLGDLENLKAAAGILEWVIKAGGTIPRLLPGLESNRSGSGISLKLLDRSAVDNLYEYWNQPSHLEDAFSRAVASPSGQDSSQSDSEVVSAGGETPARTRMRVYLALLFCGQVATAAIAVWALIKTPAPQGNPEDSIQALSRELVRLDKAQRIGQSSAKHERAEIDLVAVTVGKLDRQVLVMTDRIAAVQSNAKAIASLESATQTARRDIHRYQSEIRELIRIKPQLLGLPAAHEAVRSISPRLKRLAALEAGVSKLYAQRESLLGLVRTLGKDPREFFLSTLSSPAGRERIVASVAATRFAPFVPKRRLVRSRLQSFEAPVLLDWATTRVMLRLQMSKSPRSLQLNIPAFSPIHVKSKTGLPKTFSVFYEVSVVAGRKVVGGGKGRAPLVHTALFTGNTIEALRRRVDSKHLPLSRTGGDTSCFLLIEFAKPTPVGSLLYSSASLVAMDER